MSTLSAPQKFSYLFPDSLSSDALGALSLQWAAVSGPFGAERALALNDALPTPQLRRGAFTPAECAAIVALGGAASGTAGRVELGADTCRVSTIVWFGRGDTP